MTYSALAAPRAAYRPARVKTPAFALPTIKNGVVFTTMACLLGLLYLVQVTAVNANGYRLDNVQAKAAALQSENDDLTLANARLQGLDRVQEYAVDSGLVSVAPQ